MSEHRHHGSWAVWLNDTDRDHNGQPFRLDVRPSNGSHVTEEDAEWLRGVIRAATRRRSPETFKPSFGSLVQMVTSANDEGPSIGAEGPSARTPKESPEAYDEES